MKKSIIIAAIAALFALGAQAQSIHYNGTDDTVPAIKVYNGYAGALSIVVSGSGTGLVVTVDSLANAINGDGNDDTVAELAAVIQAVTNTSGQAKLVVDTSWALGTDSTDAELLNGTYTAASGAWATIPWDTSAAKFYQVAIPSRDPIHDRNGDQILAGRYPATAFNVVRIYGQPTGTGSATVKAYVNGSEVFSKVIAESYVLGAGGTNVLDSVINVDESVTIPVPAQDGVIVRASRATTAAGGNIGFVAEQ
jgi:hypothetical protein